MAQHSKVNVKQDSEKKNKPTVANKKNFKAALPIISFLMIYGLPTQQGYATLHAFRCIIWVSWDLIKITASKIPVKWKFTEDNTLYILMQIVSIPCSGIT